MESLVERNSFKRGSPYCLPLSALSAVHWWPVAKNAASWRPRTETHGDQGRHLHSSVASHKQVRNGNRQVTVSHRRLRHRTVYRNYYFIYLFIIIYYYARTCTDRKKHQKLKSKIHQKLETIEQIQSE